MSNRRSRRIVASFQLRASARIAAYAFIYQLTVWNLMFCLQYGKTGGNFIEAYRAFAVDNYPMLLCVLVLAPAFAWDAAKYLHRIAGPIYRFRRTMESVTADDVVQPIQLREGDELKDMQDEFNAMLEALAARGAVRLAKSQTASSAAGDENAPPLRLAQ